MDIERKCVKGLSVSKEGPLMSQERQSEVRAGAGLLVSVWSG